MSESEAIKVYVIERNDRTNLMMRYVDPMTNKPVERSTGTTDRKEAEKVAAKWEGELQAGRWAPRSKITWEGFRDRYESEVLPGLAEKTANKVGSVFNWVEEVLNPRLLADVTQARLSYLQSQMRKRKLSEPTIKGNLAHLAAALNWAGRMGLLAKVPKVEMPRRAKGSKVMKGRPITLEEFERLLDKVPVGLFGKPKKDDKPLTEKQQAARARIVESWRHYLRGLWASGLRLAESLELWWDRDDKLCVDLDGKRPMLRIPKGLEKGHKDRLLPMAPEFFDFLAETPEANRTGPVFHPLATRIHAERLTAHRVGEIVVKIGEAAGVKVHTDQGTGKVKYASAHDLRRSFGERWAHRLMPTDLMALMRHESMETTLRYYVGRNAEATADILWEAHRRNLGDTLGDRAGFGAPSRRKGKAASQGSNRT